MDEDTVESFCFPAARRKKVTAAFDGGHITSDGGVVLLAAVDRRMGMAQRVTCASVVMCSRSADYRDRTGHVASNGMTFCTKALFLSARPQSPLR
jgi:hypothetical protein